MNWIKTSEMPHKYAAHHPECDLRMHEGAPAYEITVRKIEVIAEQGGKNEHNSELGYFPEMRLP